MTLQKRRKINQSIPQKKFRSKTKNVLKEKKRKENEKEIIGIGRCPYLTFDHFPHTWRLC